MSVSLDHHEPLRDDVRMLGRRLGEALQAREGLPFYDQVESIRQWAHQAVSGDPAARARIDSFLGEADAGALIWRDKAGVRTDVQRLVEMWSALLQEHGGPMLFGEFTVADAYFAPVCMRLHTYALPVPAHITAYVNRVRALPGVQAWIAEALGEKDFLAFEEPYRLRHTED